MKKAKIRVLMLSDYFYPHVGGGVEKVVYELSKRLVDFGCDILVITLGDEYSSYNVNGVKVFKLPSVDLTKFLQIQLSIPRSIKALAQTVKDFSPDIVHAHNVFFATSLLAVLIKWFSRGKMVFTAHLGKIEKLRLLGRWKVLAAEVYEKIAGRIILSSSDIVIAVSNSVRDHVLSLGVPSEKVVVIPNGVDINEFNPSLSTQGVDRINNIIFVGRLIPNKGLEYLVEAAKILICSRISGVKFRIVGDGPYRQRFEELINEHKLASYFEILGRVPKVSDVLQEGGIFVRPSLTEGMPLTVLEAMASGLPIVATRVAGTPELIIHGETGMLVEPGDARQLAETIKFLIQHPDEAIRLGRNARAFIERHYKEKFSWEAAASNLLSVYMSLLR